MTIANDREIAKTSDFSQFGTLAGTGSLSQIGTMGQQLLQKIKPALNGAGGVIAVRIAGAGVGYISQIAFARWMGMYEYGIYAYAWSWIMLLGFIAPLGFNISVMKFLPDYKAKGNLPHLSGMIKRGPLIVFAISSAFAASLIALVLGMPDLIESYYTFPLIIAFATLPIIALGLHFEAVARGFGWTFTAYVPAYLLRPTLFFAFATVFILANLNLNATIAMSLMLIVCICVVAFQGAAINKKVKPWIDGIHPVTQTLPWLKTSLPFLLIEIFYLITTNLDVLILGYFVSPEAVGIYFVASRICSLLGYIPFGVAALAIPKYAEYNSRGDIEGLAIFARQMTRWSFIPTAAGALVLFVIGAPLLSIFGTGYTEGYAVLVLLIFGILVKAAIGPVHYLLAMTGHQNISIGILAISALLNLALSIVLIPAYGIEGAAISTTATFAVSGTAMVLLAWRKLGFRSTVF